MSDARPRRSALYMPASNLRAIDKARGLPCDVVILDLEDAVAPDAKAQARRNAVEAVGVGGFGRREVVVRVNGLDTPWGCEDLTAIRQVRPDAILAPKISSRRDVAEYATFLDDGVPLWVMIETCSALFQLDGIGSARRETGLSAFVIGSNDLAKELRCDLDVSRAALVTSLCLAVAAARAHELAILDGVFNALDDPHGLLSQCEQGRSFGFDGKTLIHPGQIETANCVFAPTANSIDWSLRILAAFERPENASAGVLRVEGRMVERLHLAEAQRLISVFNAIQRVATDIVPDD